MFKKYNDSDYDINCYLNKSKRKTFWNHTILNPHDNKSLNTQTKKRRRRKNRNSPQQKKNHILMKETLYLVMKNSHLL